MMEHGWIVLIGQQEPNRAICVCQESFAVHRVRRKHEKNATSMARRFSSLAGLKLLVKNELTASATAREKALKTLQDITDVYHERPDSLVEQVSPSRMSRPISNSQRQSTRLHGAHPRAELTRGDL